MLSKIFPKIHAEGYKFLVIAGIITIIFYTFSDLLGLIGLVLTVWVYYFFRDPERVISTEDDIMVSPADGVVSLLEHAVPPSEMGLGNEPMTRVSVFMSVFNCHVNRIPAAGRITTLAYHHGKFLNHHRYQTVL